MDGWVIDTTSKQQIHRQSSKFTYVKWQIVFIISTLSSNLDIFVFLIFLNFGILYYQQIFVFYLF